MVIGLDGCRKGWVAVVLDPDGKFEEARSVAKLGDERDWLAAAEAVGVDMPLQLVEAPRREADRAARAALGPARGRSVFPAPPAFALEEEWIGRDYASVNAEAKRRHATGIPKQAFQLRDQIYQVNELAGALPGLREVHPELSFMTMAGQPPRFPKRSWGGFRERLALLERAGIVVPAELPEGVGSLPADDVLDAAAAAWTAWRVSRGEARSFPEEDGPRIWA